MRTFEEIMEELFQLVEVAKQKGVYSATQQENIDNLKFEYYAQVSDAELLKSMEEEEE